ncbi:MAG: Tm-1-like ATP-binding domain-containing protein [Gemmatimonadetes bacterium]|nr:Tm-1-like ATP-binding domain-containing protein [Gemmatimonadota bacterium]
MGEVLLIATLDTKGDEAAYVRALATERGHRVHVLDAGVLGEPTFAPDVAAAAVAAAGGETLDALRRRGDRGVALEVMARGAAAIAARLAVEGRIDGVLGMGGSCGTAIATAAMRELPVGIPKVMVSTVASGQVGPYVGVKDVTLMYAVVDVAGLNRITRRILANAVGAVCGMIEQVVPESSDRPLVAATMFGVTTPCVDRVRSRLDGAGFEVLVFHATGSGGRAMEGLIDAGFISGVADVTTTEWCDELVGGVLSAGPTRLEAAARAGIPQIVSCGALDMVNFWAPDTIPQEFRTRRLHVHNPNVTLMRTTAAESARLGEIIATKLNAATGPVTVMLPLRGVSALDHEGQPFHDPVADAALFDALRTHLDARIERIELDLHINDPAFADAIASRLLDHLNAEIPSDAVHSA